jgi:TPR repeat protein
VLRRVGRLLLRLQRGRGAVAQGDGGLPASPETSRQLFAKACGLSDGSGCANLGSAYATAIGGPTHLDEARKAFKKGCDLGNAYACTSLGSLLPTP